MTGPKRRSGSVSAAALLAQLERDPVHQQMASERDVERERRQQESRKAQQQILDDLTEVGVEVGSVWELVNTSVPYPSALHVLMAHLERGGYPDPVTQAVARALAVKPSVVFWDRLKALYSAPRSEAEEDGVAVALAACATACEYDDLVEFLSQAERGPSRVYFLRPILRLGSDKGRKLLASLESDPVFGREAAALLGDRR